MHPSKKLPTLSVVIPAYNEVRHLPKCLDAIAAQTVPADEVIVVNNGSTDETAEVAGRYSFVTVLLEPQRGIVFARNRGFDAAHSDIIARIDADTILPEGWIERVKNFYAAGQGQKKIVTGGCYFYNLHSGKLTGRMYDLIVFRFNRLLLGYYFPWGSNSALPREAWEKVRPQVIERPELHEDLDLGIHLNRAGYEIAYVNSRVGAIARRIKTNRGELWEWLAMWPRTFRANGKRRGLLVWPFVVAVWLGTYWILLTERVADLFS